MKHQRSLMVLVALGVVALSTTGLAEDQPKVAMGASSAVALSDAGAQQVSVPSEILVLHATNSDAGGGEPPMPELKKPPFSAYNNYQILARHPVALAINEPHVVTLPDGRVLKTVLKAVLPQDRYQVASSISRPAGKDKETSFLPLLEVTARSGEPFFVAGQSFRGGILVLGIRVGNPPAQR